MAQTRKDLRGRVLRKGEFFTISGIISWHIANIGVIWCFIDLIG